MGIQYWAMLGRAWRRMKALLFRPLDPVKWLVLAFCAWVAGLLDGYGGGGGGGGGDHGVGRGPHFEPGNVGESIRAVLEAVRDAWQWVLGHWGATLFVFVGIPLVIALLVAVVWVSSRFKLIFLDNVVRGRAEIVEPWRRLARLGDSLFLFRLGFGVVTFAVGAALVLALVSLGIFTAASRGSAPGIAGLAVGGLLFLVFVVATAYASLFLESFVAPIMYRQNLTVVPAWQTFLPWLSAEGASFFLYGLFVLLLLILAAFAIVTVALATCCVGLVVLMIPFVGTLVLLPFIVTYRYLSLEFLAQFDASLDVFGSITPSAAEAQG
jgi:hypothetical protein